MKKLSPIRIGRHVVGEGQPTYIISEVGSNFDGDLGRAKHLADISKDIGADAYKIQNFTAPKIVSQKGFSGLKVAFQAKWDKPVVEVYKNAEFPREWLEELSAHCKKIGIDFFSSPYDAEAVDMLEDINVPAHKIGSGEIDNLPFLALVARTKKPIIVGVGAATMKEIESAVKTIRKAGNEKIVLLQCVTNYPAPMRDSNINAMVTLRDTFGVQVGYSDHTVGPQSGGDDPLDGITVPLGAVALGGCMIEKHFTDDRKRKGPDHPFAMDIPAFSQMVKSIRALETALGDGQKKLMPSEKQTVIIQRRGVYAKEAIEKGEKLSSGKIEYLRPAVSLRPGDVGTIIGKRAKRAVDAGEPLSAKDFK